MNSLLKIDENQNEEVENGPHPATSVKKKKKTETPTPNLPHRLSILTISSFSCVPDVPEFTELPGRGHSVSRLTDFCKKKFTARVLKCI